MKRIFFGIACLCISASLFSQKQLVILKNGRVQATFKEGEYMRFVLKKNHRHAEGHIIELYDFYMITSNDTIQLKDILKVNIKSHRGAAGFNKGIGGLLFLGGIIYLTVDQLNVAIGINASSSPAEIYVPLAASAWVRQWFSSGQNISESTQYNICRR